MSSRPAVNRFDFDGLLVIAELWPKSPFAGFAAIRCSASYQHVRGWRHWGSHVVRVGLLRSLTFEHSAPFLQVCVHGLVTGKPVRSSSRIRGVRLPDILHILLFVMESADDHHLFRHGHVGECGFGLASRFWC